MLKEAGITATLIGHSERRQYFGETDASVARKVKATLDAGMLPIVCVGETRAEREAGKTAEVVIRQTNAFLEVVQAHHDFVIAYEPVWAIGTGLNATNAQAQEVHLWIRQLLHKKFGAPRGEQIRILYGGSANPGNIDGLLQEKDIDGGLVGGASLKPVDFAKMVKSARMR
jgi:triosephosphate isomerase